MIFSKASYHTRTEEGLPNSKSGKKECILYLEENDVPFDPKSEKQVLWKAVQAHIKEHKKYVAEKLAEKYKIIICRFPPYHCEFNPIERVWAYGKGKLRKQNIWNQNDLLEKAIKIFNEIDADYWAKCVEHSKKQEKLYSRYDKLDLYPEDHDDLQGEIEFDTEIREENEPVVQVVELENVQEDPEDLKCGINGCDWNADCSLNLARHREGNFKIFQEFG